MKWVAALFAGVVAAALVGAVILSGSGAKPTGGTAEIVMTEMRFTPNLLSMKVGQAVLVTVVNKGAQRHDLAFPSLQMPGLAGLETITEPGERRTLTLKFDKPGEFTFLCDIPGHAAAGMTGAVVVRP